MSSSMICFRVASHSFRARLRRRGGRIALAAVGVLILLALTRWEMETSTLQAGPFSWSARRLSYEVAPGPSTSIRFPDAGPFDERLGYSRLPRMLERLSAQGYVVDRQARPSALLARFTDLGLFP